MIQSSMWGNMSLNSMHFYSKKRIIAYSLLGAILVNSLLANIKNEFIDKPGSSIEFVRNVEINDLKELIYSSSFLTNEEKDYLFNEDFLSDILPFININILNRLKYQKHLSNLAIYTYGQDDYNNEFLGYYTSSNPNQLFIRNYDDFVNHKNTVAHEFIHLCQVLGTYNLIIEACAEIISFEYFEDAKIDAYTTPVKLVKKLMEIIGPEPVWIYNFTGNFETIEEEVMPYLTPEQYSLFLECLTISYSESENNLKKYEQLDELLGIIYKNKYNDDISNNEVMQVLNDSTAVLTRYYFNKRFINQENSFYYRRQDVEYGKLDYQTAMEMNIFYAYATKLEPITYEEAIEGINNGTFSVNRIIDFKANDIIIYHRRDEATATIISAKIDGVRYDEASLDDLVKQGIIKVDYYKIYFQTLTADDYINHRCMEGAEIYTIYYKKELTLHEDYIEGYIPIIHKLKPIKAVDFTRKLKK